MPLLDHFHPPLHGSRHWEGFHQAWTTTIAQQLNQEALPPDYYAEPEISLGPILEIDIATKEQTDANPSADRGNTVVWSPSRPKIVAQVDFAHLDSFEVRVYQELGGAELRAAIELVSPANKDREGSRRTFAAKCAGYLTHGIGVVVIDVVTERSANLHREIFETLEVEGRPRLWESSTGLYAVAYRAVTVRKRPRVEAWPEKLTLGKPLPLMPLWLALDLCVPLPLEQSYATTCRSLRISA
jgi:hypothetical protein